MNETEMVTSNDADALRAKILEMVAQYHQAAFPEQTFVPGTSIVPVSGRVFDAKDVTALVSSSLEFWLTAGHCADEFEKRFAAFVGVKLSLLVNSGSSANLVAATTLTSPQLKSRRLLPGDEVITVACGFPTTVNPIVQNRLVPVFVDVAVPTYNIDVTQLEAALSPRTRAIMLAHTLGNPFDLATVKAFADAHKLFLIEDCCDALGSTFGGKNVGTWGDLATVSFYPAHHITMGEGGAVLTSQLRLKRIAESFRDWGRDCWCAPGRENTCGLRFEHSFAGMPAGYDHKYTYSHIGYNLKVTDMQAAVGLSQLEKAERFIQIRKDNFSHLKKVLRPFEEFLILPEATPSSDPSWFGFAIAVRPGAPFSREELVRYLEDARIATRLLFGGNILRQPAYKDIKCRVIGKLKNADFVMENVFWVGVYPGLSHPMLDYVAETIGTFIRTMTK